MRLCCLALCLAACGAQTPVASGDAAVTQRAPITRIEIPGVSSDFIVEKIAAHTFVLRAYSNAVIYDTGSGLVLIDTMRPAFLGGSDLADMKTTLQTLKDRGEISSTDVKTIANTHWHPDHVGNNDAFRTPATEVVAGRGGKLRTATPQTINFFGAKLPAWPSSFWPSREVHKSDWSQPDDVSYFYTTYSHTSTDLVIMLPKERVYVLGDLVLQGMLAFTDVDNGGSSATMLNVLDDALRGMSDDCLVVPGHNQVMTKAEAMDWLRTVGAGHNYVHALVRDGQTLEQIQATADLPVQRGGAPAELKALDGALFPLSAFVSFVFRDITEHWYMSTIKARVLAYSDAVTKEDMKWAILFLATGTDNAAGSEFETFAFQVRELQAIDELSSDKILSEEANAVFAIYERYVQQARDAGSKDLTPVALAAMRSEISAF